LYSSYEAEFNPQPDPPGVVFDWKKYCYNYFFVWTNFNPLPAIPGTVAYSTVLQDTTVRAVTTDTVQ
jgi:hypothetical protein